LRYFDLETYSAALDPFNQNYWSGKDAKIFIDDIYLTDALEFNYSLAEALDPVRHYSSYTVTTMAQGSRIVQGQFSMLTTQMSFIHYLVDEVRKRKGLEPITNYTSEPVQTQPQAPTVPESTATFADAADIFNYIRATDQNTPVNTPVVAVRARGTLLELPRGTTMTIAFGEYAPTSSSIIRPKPNDMGYEIADYTFQSSYRSSSSALHFEGVTIQSKVQSYSDDGKPVLETFSFLAKTIKEVQI